MTITTISITTKSIQESVFSENLPVCTCFFLQDYPMYKSRIEGNENLVALLENSGLEKAKNQKEAYQALCVYFGISQRGNSCLVFENGMTLFHFAGLGGQESYFQESSQWTSLRSVYGVCPLHCASMGGQLAVLQKLEQVCDLRVIDDVGRSIAEYAFVNNEKEIIDWLSTQEEFSVAVLMKYLQASSYKEDPCFYTTLGLKILQFLDSKSFILSLEETYEPLENSVFLFYLIYFILIRIIKKEPHPEEKNRLEDLIAKRCVCLKDKNLLKRIEEYLLSMFLQEKELIKKLDSERNIASFSDRAVVFLDQFLKHNELNQKRYEIKEDCLLGSGSFGEVYQSFDKCSGRAVAIKIGRFLTRNTLEEENRWFNFLKLRKNERILQKLDFGFVHRRHSAIVMPLYDCNLRQWIKKQPICLQFEIIQKIAKQILEGCLFLKEHNLVYRDLKSDNILINARELEIVLSDFNSLGRLEECSLDKEVQSSFYRSPEVFVQATQYYGHAMDMWSYGCVLFELFQKKRFFAEEKEETIVFRHQETFGLYPEDLINRRSREKFPGWLPLEKSKQYSLENHLSPWKEKLTPECMASVFSLFERVMELHPLDRLPWEDLRDHSFWSFKK